MTRIDTLPINHPLRNTRLGELDAYYRIEGMKQWKKVFPSFKIAKCTLNQLGPLWHKDKEWMVDDDTKGSTETLPQVQKGCS